MSVEVRTGGWLAAASTYTRQLCVLVLDLLVLLYTCTYTGVQYTVHSTYLLLYLAYAYTVRQPAVTRVSSSLAHHCCSSLGVRDVPSPSQVLGLDSNWSMVQSAPSDTMPLVMGLEEAVVVGRDPPKDEYETSSMSAVHGRESAV